MQKLQLYIENERVELFDDETVSLTQSIQNVKDIDKVFTTYTKTFSVPAGKNNNKIFKHYYNFDIVDGFDARIKVGAKIELNTMPFRKGKVKLEGVTLKNRKPHTYKITFFGDTVELKDLLGDDDLSDLGTELDAYNRVTTSDSMRGGLYTDPATNDMVVPLITHTQRLYYNSSENVSDTGNLYRHSSGAGNKHGLLWTELKWALRVDAIVRAIERKYNLTFSNDFFDSSNPQYYDLFMWLHRKSGKADKGDQTETFTRLVNTFPGGTYNTFFMTDTLFFPAYNSADVNVWKLLLRRTTTSFTYTVTIYGDDTPIHTFDVTTVGTYQYTMPILDWDNYLEFKVEISYSAAGTLDMDFVIWQVDYYDYNTGFNTSEQVSTGAFTVDAEFEFVVSNQIPEIKTIDFLTGLFKMFNLTAFVQKDGIVYVDTLDNFYANQTTSFSPWNITEYVDTESQDVNVALPFREINFRYKDTNTFLAKQHNNLFNSEWGALKYTQTDANGNRVSGQLYKVEAPFSHMKFERLVDLDDNTQTSVQWGWSVDQSQNPYKGAPLLFYPVRQRTEDDGAFVQLSYVTEVNDDGTFKTVEGLGGTINMPSNSVSFDVATSDDNIHYKNEFNEYAPSDNFAGTLFNNFYVSYIEKVFNPKQRITKVKAFLPLNILRRYSLADIFVYNDHEYKINQITTNLQSGESTIELLNVI